jgi:hypothetical protein
MSSGRTLRCAPRRQIRMFSPGYLAEVAQTAGLNCLRFDASVASTAIRTDVPKIASVKLTSEVLDGAQSRAIWHTDAR